jgi:hypothetical protein
LNSGWRAGKPLLAGDKSHGSRSGGSGQGAPRSGAERSELALDGFLRFVAHATVREDPATGIRSINTAPEIRDDGDREA